MAETQTETTSHDSRRRKLEGVITSDKMMKTVVVLVTHRVRSQQYKKYMTRRVKYKAHSENNEFKAGDKVEITESRPLSRDLVWFAVGAEATQLRNRLGAE